MTTGAVRIRPLTFADWPAVHGWAGLPEACRYQAWGPNTAEQTQEFVREAAGAWQQQPRRRFPHAVTVEFPHAVTVEETVVGIAELHLRANRQAEIGYGIHPGSWGRGLATAAARLLLEAAFTEHGAHRVFATCDPRNVGSARVLTKLGMLHEGRMRETMLLRDGWRDSDLYAILRHEWTPAPR